MDGAHLLCESLRELRVPFFAGIPGTDTTDVYDIAESYGIRPIVVRNEQFAPMFADGYARVSRKYGAVVSIPGLAQLRLFRVCTRHITVRYHCLSSPQIFLANFSAKIVDICMNSCTWSNCLIA